ncbi:methyltransferase domain-containing protein [Candidatus Microgenomates bacterium]|nr:methyltransferase domain-containing protein [Candidatus Microgenomates bacterium]
MVQTQKHNFRLLDMEGDGLLRAQKGPNTPRSILIAVGIEKGETVVDFGCGVGYFLPELAAIVGDDGKIIAIDIDSEALTAAKAQVMKAGHKNIYGMQADLTLPSATGLAKDSIDAVLIINLLYLVKNKKAVLKEAARILRPGGRLAVMEWSEKGPHEGLEKDQYLSFADIKKICDDLGLSSLRRFESGLSHETFIFEKK